MISIDKMVKELFISENDHDVNGWKKRAIMWKLLAMALHHSDVFQKGKIIDVIKKIYAADLITPPTLEYLNVIYEPCINIFNNGVKKQKNKIEVIK